MQVLPTDNCQINGRFGWCCGEEEVEEENRQRLMANTNTNMLITSKKHRKMINDYE